MVRDFGKPCRRSRLYSYKVKQPRLLIKIASVIEFTVTVIHIQENLRKTDFFQ